MKTDSRHITLLTLLCTAAAGLLCACAADDEPQPTAKVRELTLSMSPRQYEALVTRADASVADPYELYNYSTNLAKIDQIQAYLTATNLKNGETEQTVISAPFTYQRTSDSWESRVPLLDGQYYIYGFMPIEGVGSSVDVAPISKDYKNGAVITMHDLNAVSPDDICIIVGAEGYGSTDKTSLSNPSDMTKRLGQFGYHTSDGDKLFLLADHLYAGLEFRLKMNADYSNLRRIKINRVSLIPDTKDGSVVEKVQAKVTVSNTVDDGSTPTVDGGSTAVTPYSVEFTTTSTGTSPEPAVLNRGENEWLSTTETVILACFCPVLTTKFVLRTEYDVYGREGKNNLIRQNQTAENHITLQYDLKSGQKHIVNITVNPTYLYVLSDPDLDNPTFSVSSN